MRKSEELARRWMPGVRQGNLRPAWAHPQDLVNLLSEMKRDLSHQGQPFDQIYDTLTDMAWAHDLLEDGRKSDGSKVTVGDLLTEGLAEEVVGGVVALSQKDGEDKVVYLARLRFSSSLVMIVKCVDRICNLLEGRGIFEDKRWYRYVQETTDYILPLTSDIAREEGNWLMERLLHARDAR